LLFSGAVNYFPHFYISTFLQIATWNLGNFNVPVFEFRLILKTHKNVIGKRKIHPRTSQENGFKSLPKNLKMAFGKIVVPLFGKNG